MVIKEGVTEHLVNAVSVRWSCNKCADSDLMDEISTCDICMPIFFKQQNTIKNVFNRRKYWCFYTCDYPIENFLDWLLTAFCSKYDVIIYSHNGGR